MLDEAYDEIFRKTFNVAQEELGADFTFSDNPNWDSLAHLELIAALEDRFEIMLDPDEITHFGSYENGKNILRAHDLEIG
ncbi:acyl carrier protein [Eggerthella guodeyinii]|uniref:Acyl carrier protein n=1 Tax=Eggerthella guodeyinii TaxID=2690837 RepID=A0A6N7RRR8_9ACTN|nr:acyl carrier protein [Eggerthella guodeyinii]MRX84063.1 acyl carrier protein [Eggerthella guodeyinii]